MAALPFSRFPESFEPNPLTLALRRAREDGRRLLDLTLTNPTRAGLDYPVDLLQPLGAPQALIYEPEPLGHPAARRAIAADYERLGSVVDPDRIVLTASTSEAYAWLFKLICRPADDDVLIPAPSYPLFDHLTRLEGIRAAPYRLDYHRQWSIDFDSLERAWTDEVRAVLVVSPNNPTGAAIAPADLAAVGARCAYFGAALIVDEVFVDYPLQDRPLPPLAVPVECLTFRLGGLSKSAGLPQVKLGWLAVDGPAQLVARSLQHLELIADTYLSVSTPVQLAAPALIASGEYVRTQILERVRRNYAALRGAVATRSALEVLEADAGWSAVLRVPAVRPEDELVMALLEDDDVLVHPGYFFDFDRGCHLVLSLLPEPATFDEGLRRIVERCDG